MEELEQRMAQPGFWDDPERARSVISRSQELKAWTEPFEELSGSVDELLELTDLLREEPDGELAGEVQQELRTVERRIEKLEQKRMLMDPDAHRDALVTIHPGAGGLESQDWAEMLMEMYLRWAESGGYEAEVMDLVTAEEAGIKSATLEIRGDHPYGYLSAERGVHRLVRISPFDNASRRHTSFASVFVYPVVDRDIEIEIDEDDLRIDTFRASGAGGQHVNKTDSAVRITHEPTEIVVSCQQERSQHKNRAKAMKMLRAALYQRAVEEREQEKRELREDQKEIAFGSQIRSYVLHPYQMVKDHRTGVETGDVDGVLGGDLDEFIEAYLKQNGAEEE